jgi:hypothetical protein
MKTINRYIQILILAIPMLLISAQSHAQLTLGAGFSGLKYLGNGSSRPLDGGVAFNLGLDINDKTTLMLDPTVYFPLTYRYDETISINNVPTVTRTNERFKTLELCALLQYDLIGSGSNPVLYFAAGPGLAIYNTSVTRDNALDYNYSMNFKDILLDARVGMELPMGLIHPFAEVEVAPVVASTIQSDVNYKPNRGTILAGTVGLRLRL